MSRRVSVQVVSAIAVTLLFAAFAPAQVVLPRNLTEAEKAYIEYLDANTTGGYLWECFPDLAGFTDPPPITARFPTESEQTRGALYGWPSYGNQMPELTELIRNSIGRAEVTVMVPENLFTTAQFWLLTRGLTQEDLDQIYWFRIPPDAAPFQNALDGIWIRDYGPEVLEDEDGSSLFIDLGYYSSLSTNCTLFPNSRPNDDVSPTRFAPNFLKGVNVFRPQLRTEGGNLQTDGQGTCVHMTRDVLRQNRFTRWFYSQEELDAVYTQYFNCSRVISLESLGPDPGYPTQGVIDHVDMIMTFISPTKILMAQIDPLEDPRNAAILDRNAQTMEKAGYTVVRIPMPKRYCTVRRGSCISSPGDARDCGGAGLDRVWATYANSIRVGNAMMVPVYRDVPPSLQDAIAKQEAEALGIFQQELDAEFGKGAVEVIPIVSDRMIPCQGSVHCITMTYK
jgi:agmatine/peptidylarginine deiminase